MDLLPWLSGHPWLWSSCRSLPAELLPSLSHPNLLTPVKSLIRSVIFISWCCSYPSTLLAAFLCFGSHPSCPALFPWCPAAGLVSQDSLILSRWSSLLRVKLGREFWLTACSGSCWGQLNTSKNSPVWLHFPWACASKDFQRLQIRFVQLSQGPGYLPVSPAQHQFHHPSLWGEKVLKEFCEVAVTHSRAVICSS